MKDYKIITVSHWQKVFKLKIWSPLPVPPETATTIFDISPEFICGLPNRNHNI